MLCIITANPYIDQVGEKDKLTVAVDSEELKRLNQLFNEPDSYSTAYNAPTQKARRGFKIYDKGNPYSLNNKIKGSSGNSE
ncbi:hypothetical protein TNCV_4598722 [Trichonephila clavipes]|nr:hypothetical protein TNCV_4598722 [Trichonephila clavipes]